mmetsp:Transcript_5101/g.21810  ORF Transcript_5101/g.21810 Transcript_5101/m.21810 type:complete len:227 (-) Transcript_5101:171-851(-)
MRAACRREARNAPSNGTPGAASLATQMSSSPPSGSANDSSWGFRDAPRLRSDLDCAAKRARIPDCLSPRASDRLLHSLAPSATPGAPAWSEAPEAPTSGPTFRPRFASGATPSSPALLALAAPSERALVAASRPSPPPRTASASPVLPPRRRIAPMAAFSLASSSSSSPPSSPASSAMVAASLALVGSCSWSRSPARPAAPTAHLGSTALHAPSISCPDGESATLS